MKITELGVRPGDYKLLLTSNETYYWFQTEYERIEERGWGCMNPASQISGLCTDLVDTCFVFVFHYGANGRTTLCHVVSGTDITVFNAQMSYFAGADPASQLDTVVFQGLTYGVPGDVPSEILEEDLMWVWQTPDHLRIRTTSCNTFVHPKPLGHGVVLVHRGFPRFLRCVPSQPTSTMFAKRRVVDAFYGIQSTASFIASKFRSVPCFETINGRSSASPSCTRILVLEAYPAVRLGHLQACDANQRDGDVCEIRMVGAPCEVPGYRKLTTEKCAACKGAYYCSRSHQEEHWGSTKDGVRATDTYLGVGWVLFRRRKESVCTAWREEAVDVTKKRDGEVVGQMEEYWKE
ncbi:hypothetical protein B0H19DRAFT_1295709 [Mycena capillaripes]|nr:hypothetical protein B0H19DRAFT_1295709 [Mycena capillaripes]